MDPNIIDRVLARNASPEEARQVAAWFSTDEGQEYLSRRYDREAPAMDDATITRWIDHDVPGDKMEKRFLSHLKPRIKSFRFRMIAAAIIPLLVLACAFNFVANRSGGIFQSGELEELSVPYGEQSQIVLQDGTVVHLNSGSRLRYPKSFGLFQRKVMLDGEGYFKVAKESGRKFIVDLGAVDVAVTGTRFNAKAYSDDNIITVALEEGGVNIADNNHHVYTLVTGQTASYDKRTGICTLSEENGSSPVAEWRNRSLNFYRVPLGEILKTLERQYEVQFVVDESSVLNYKFSISTSKININEILADIEKISKIRFTLSAPGTYEVVSEK